MSGGDRRMAGVREQRVADARDVDEKKRGAAGRHFKTPASQCTASPMIPDSAHDTGPDPGDDGRASSIR